MSSLSRYRKPVYIIRKLNIVARQGDEVFFTIFNYFSCLPITNVAACVVIMLVLESASLVAYLR
jgi:hypothetical protein